MLNPAEAGTIEILGGSDACNGISLLIVCGCSSMTLASFVSLISSCGIVMPVFTVSIVLLIILFEP